ncbi:MAG: serine acetyltransferase [Thermoguttaceae bacterium]|nr:serine acetyltransferase [Thermoguttaceae bacterium]
MSDPIKEEEIDQIVRLVLTDYEGGKSIDEEHIANKPDKGIVREIARELLKIAFPGYYKENSYNVYNPKHCFAAKIENVFFLLNEQIYLALDFCKKRGILNDAERKAEAYRVCKAFFNAIPKVRALIETDLKAAYDGDPAAGCYDEIVLAYPGITAIAIHRFAHELYKLDVPVVPRLMSEYAHSETGIDIHPGATIGERFFIDHGTGVVVGETTVIGANVKLYQGVTLGALSTRGGQKLSGKKRHPTIGNNVTIYAGASILGGSTVVGENATIGGNAFITRSIGPNTKVSIKNQELEYRTSDNKRATEEVLPGDEWFYVI